MPVLRFSAALLLASSALAAAVPASAQTAPAVANERVPTWVFGKRPFMRAPRLSPDGSKIAVMMSKDGVDNLGFIDLSKPGAARA